MRFKTKWDLLEHLWKDRTYVRYVDKLMLRDIVSMVDWEYEYNDPYDEELRKYDEEIQGYKKRISELEDRVKEKEQIISWQNEYIRQLEQGEREDWDNSEEVIEAVYTFLTRSKRLMLDHDDFVEWVKNVL